MVNKLKILKGYSKNNCEAFSFSCRWVGEIEVPRLARSSYFSGWDNAHTFDPNLGSQYKRTC
jgi:hypothetical protein